MGFLLNILLIAGGGASGALARAGVGWLFVEKVGVGALGTLTVNLLGCLLFGAARAGVEQFEWGTDQQRTFLFTGVLGAFTTFSTFEADVFTLWTDELRFWSVLYVFASVVGGILCFVVGYFLVARLRG